MYKLRKWIDETKLTKGLSLNENAISYLEEHPDKIDKCLILYNINAINIIGKNVNMCNRSALNENPGLINLLRNNKHLIWSMLYYHEHCIELVEELIKNNELVKIHWSNLSSNGAAIHILEQYPEKINWYSIIVNENAEHLIRNNLEKVEEHWDHICEQPHLISLIEEHPEKIVWYNLSRNYKAVHLLKNNLEKICMNGLCHNKDGFELLMIIGHQFNDELYYDCNIIYAYWNYCITHNIEFVLMSHLCGCGYTDEHFEFIKSHTQHYDELSHNPHIFIYDYSRMKKTRQQQPWYNYIKNEFI